MLEKDFEISKLKEENDTLKETMENITRASAVKTEQGEKAGKQHRICMLKLSRGSFVKELGACSEKTVNWDKRKVIPTTPTKNVLKVSQRPTAAAEAAAAASSPKA